MDTTNDPTNNDAAAMERALLNENLISAITLEDAYISAERDITTTAHKSLRYDVAKGAFVSRETGEPVKVREWLTGQRDVQPHWFKGNGSHAVISPAGFDPNAKMVPPPGKTPKDAPPAGRVTKEMTEHEYVEYKKQNRHARVVSKVNVGGSRVYTVDCGSQATAAQVGGQSLEEYKKWRKDQGFNNPLVGQHQQ